jgi:hypothetical protein
VQGLRPTVDLLIEVVARDPDDLYRIAGRILDIGACGASAPRWLCGGLSTTACGS